MKSGRLLEMLLLLQARGQVTAGELAERLEVSTRTVYRDAEALSAAGVPVYTERGRAGGIRLLPGYRTDVTGLTEDEARALFVLSTGGAQEDLGLGNAARSAVLKVMRAVPAPFRPAATATSQRILVDPERWMKGPESRDPAGHLGVLQAAVFSGRRLRMRYRICAAHLVDGEDDDGGDDPEWAVVRLRFGGVAAARIMLSFGGDVEVVSPPEVRDDLAAVAAATVSRYDQAPHGRTRV